MWAPKLPKIRCIRNCRNPKVIFKSQGKNLLLISAIFFFHNDGLFSVSSISLWARSSRPWLSTQRPSSISAHFQRRRRSVWCVTRSHAHALCCAPLLHRARPTSTIAHKPGRVCGVGVFTGRRVQGQGGKGRSAGGQAIFWRLAHPPKLACVPGVRHCFVSAPAEDCKRAGQLCTPAM